MKKNENYPKYVQAVRMLKDGKSAEYVCSHLKIHRMTLRLINHRYQNGGELALLQPSYLPRTSEDKKVEIVEEIIKNGLSLSSASLKYDLPYESIRRWVCRYRQFGVSGLVRRGSQGIMKKKRQLTESELDELEMLRKRNEYLEAENALLKKVKALVEEREARLRAIGRGPSKN